MAKRPRFSRWRRLPGAYRSGDEKWPDSNEEPQRVSIYISNKVFDHAAEQAERLGFRDVQDYLTRVALKAVDEERVREHVADVESRRGPLEGLQEISDDPEYLAELQAAVISRGPAALPGPGRGLPEGYSPDRGEASVPPHDPRVAEVWSPSAMVVLRHSGQIDGDTQGFLACLRRGETVPAAEVAELAQALHQLEVEYRGVPTMGRRLTFALHRLAFESQILHTDAWPESFDHWTVDMLRSVQEAVERILSGQDIRYYASDDGVAEGRGPAGPPEPAGPGEFPR